jgi:DNA-binding ferritin-like protein
VSSEEKSIQKARKSLTDAGLVEISLDQFPERIKEVCHVAMGRLGELLARKNSVEEREGVARSVGTLKRLESKVEATSRQSKSDPPSEQG